MRYKIYSNSTCPNRRCYKKYLRRSSLLRNLINEKHPAPQKLMYSKYYRYNKNIGKLFSKYELLFLDQVSSSFDLSKILIPQFPVPRASLLPSPPLSN